MKDCKPCQPKYIPGVKRVPRCGPTCSAVAPTSAPTPPSCACKPDKIVLRTVIIPASLGTAEEGQPYAPKPGAYYDSIVLYQSTGEVYIYDSNGVFTLIRQADTEDVESAIQTIQEELKELYEPVEETESVPTYAGLDNLDPTNLPTGAVVRVENDETHDGQASLYYWNPTNASWQYAYQASPYYTRAQIDTQVNSLEEQLTTETNVREEAIATLNTALADETSAREAEDTTLQNNINTLNLRVDEIINSPDVRYIVDTHADLEAIDKSTIRDQDYARVLQDETHENASTYYQFNKTANEWTYVGQTGPYYTKEQIDSMIGDIDSILDNINGETPND